MKKQRVYTVDEVLRAQRQNPAWVAARRKEEEEYRRRAREFAALEQPILADLRRFGVRVPTIGEPALFRKYEPLAPQVVRLLLGWLPEADWRLKEWLVRLLGHPAEPYDGTVLTQVFDEVLKQDLDQKNLEEGIALKNLGWVIGDTIAEARPYGVTDWVIRKVADPYLNRSKEMLLIALARLADRQKAIPILKSMFDQFPAHCASALGEIGGEDELVFLKAKKQEYRVDPKEEKRAVGALLPGGGLMKTIQRAIRAIKERLRDNQL